MGPQRNSIRSAAALVAAVAAQQAQLDAAQHEAAARAQASLEQARISPLTAGSSGPSRALQGKVTAERRANSGGQTHIHIHNGGQSPSMTVSPEGGSTGQTQVRKASAAEKLAAKNVMDPNGGMGNNASLAGALQRGLSRVGHQFTIAVRPDGTIVHQYGNDVAPELRSVVVGAARRHAAGGFQAR